MHLRTILTILFLCFAPAVFAEVVVLKTGEAFEGTIIERTDDYIKIQTGGAPVYLSMDQIQEITDKFPDVPVHTPSIPLPDVSSPQHQAVPEIPMINGKDGQFFYDQAKREFQKGNFKESMNNLYQAASLGVEDSDKLKEQITKAMAVAEKVDGTKDELKKAVEKLDPAVQTLIFRIAMVLGVVVIGVFLVKIFTRKKDEVRESPLFSMQRMAMAAARDRGVAEGFVRAGPNKRVCAFLIDSCLIALPCLFLQLLIGAMPSTILWLVYLLVKDISNGQSLGKKIVGVQIVDLNNKPAGPNQIVMRNLIWVAVVILPLFHSYLGFASIAIIFFEYISLLRDPLGERFGDKMSLTRVYDLKPHLADWKFIFLSILTVFVWFGVYAGGMYVFAKAFNRMDLLGVQKDFRDPLNRFVMRVPDEYTQLEDDENENYIAFESPDKSRRISVLVTDKDPSGELTTEQLNMLVVSFLAMKLNTSPQNIATNSNRSTALVSGVDAVVFTYETDHGKNASACFLHSKKFYEIHFLFKQGEIDQALILRALMNFKVLAQETK